MDVVEVSNSLVVVAIPSEDDYVHKISSEKVPHLTLLFLGEVKKVKNLSLILDFVKHAADHTLNRFHLEVDRRGTLGPNLADVLFFSKSKWSGFNEINSFRSNLLKNDNIRTAYESTEQFPEWVPHITLGFPDTPANPDQRDYPGINHVCFDRIAVWFADSEGIEFPLKAHDWDDGSMAMSNGTKVVNDILEHHGIKGMKWGVRRKATVGAQEVVISDRRKKLKTSGGQGHPAHPDAVRARTAAQIAKKSGHKALSNKELQDFNQRLNLEQQAKRLAFQDQSAGKRFVLKLIGKNVDRGVQEGGKAALNSSFARKKIALGASALALA